ncbi:two-component response regulator-like APRR1 isoform X1 [Fagus crenata]
MDKGKQIMISNNGGHGGRGCNNNTMIGDAFNNQSELKILLCDSDPESCDEVSTLLTKCRYQVISVSSFVEVVDTLDAEGPLIDILLVAVDAHIDKGMKMLKYINEEFQHIPMIIILSRQDHTSLIYKYLNLGATDYLMKPLCTDELSNLWMHKGRSRDMASITLMQS